MADVTIDGSVSTATARGMRSVVFVTSAIGYWFYIDSGGQFVYSKTTNGGASWGAAVTISSATTNIAFDVWFDQWTPGDSGTVIHTWYFDSTVDDALYRTLDSNGDTLGTQRVVFAGATAVAGRGTFISGTKCRSGYLYCAYDLDAGAEKGLHRSTDGGTTWSASLSATFIEATLDEAMLFPASNTGDNNDCWAIYHDDDANALTLKMWDSSAAAAVESATIQTHLANVTDLTGQFGWSASVRNSDGHLILAAVSDRDTATADHQVWDINGTGSITAKTAIVTNIDDHYYPQVFIDQASDDIYVGYNGVRNGSDTLGTLSNIRYVVSTDGGTSWSAGNTTYSEGAAAAAMQTWGPISGPRFYMGWRIGTTLIGNAVSSISFSPDQPVTAPLISSNSSLSVPSLAYAVAAAAIVAGSTLFAPTVLPEPKLEPPAIASTASLSPPSLAYNVVGAHISSGATANAPTVDQAQNVSGSTIPTGSAVSPPTLAYAVATPAIASGSVVSAPSLAHVVSLPAIPFGSAVSPPTLAYAVVAPTLGPGSTLAAPSLAYRVDLPAIAAAAALSPPTLAYAVLPPTIASGTVLFPPSVTEDGGLGAASIASGLTVFAPTVTPDAALNSSTIPPGATIFAPILAAGPVSLSPPAIASSVVLGAPALAYAVSPPAIASVALLFAPAAAIDSSLVLATIPSGAVLRAPSVLLEQNLAPPAIASAVLLYSPAIAVVVPDRLELTSIAVAYAVLRSLECAGAHISDLEIGGSALQGVRNGAAYLARVAVSGSTIQHIGLVS